MRKNNYKKMIPVLIVAHFQEVANIAQWEDEQIEYFKEKVTEEGKQDDLKKGKAPAQVYTLLYELLRNYDRT